MRIGSNGVLPFCLSAEMRNLRELLQDLSDAAEDQASLACDIADMVHELRTKVEALMAR